MRTVIVGALVAGALTLSAAADPQRIQTTFSGSTYNSVMNEYRPAATFVTLHPRRKGNDNLIVEVEDRYWSDLYKAYRNPQIYFEKDHVPEYLAAIDKYAQWAEIAVRDGDMITKEITRTKARGGKTRFQMHSGNAESHYLVVDFCALICAEDEVLTLDYENAMALREMLEKFGSGALTASPDVADKYQ